METITDKDIIDKYSKYKSIRRSTITKEENEYLSNRFDGCDDPKEAIYRILNNITTLPKCPYCDNYVKLFSWSYGYTKTCSNKQHIKQYKQDNTQFNKKEVQDKAKQTIKEKYGVDNIFNLDIVKEHCKEVAQSVQTKTKRLNTIKERYGVDNVWKNEETKQKIRQTIKERYGDKPYNKDGTIYRKQVLTCLDKYGVSRYQSTKEFKEHMSKISPSIVEKQRKTSLQLYNDSTYNNQRKRLETMKENNSYSTSKTENLAYLYLSLEYPDIIRQYRDEERYPFNCDFYIPVLDLFIECNFHWTHGKHIYNPYSKEDQDRLLELKNKEGKYYENAIMTWTEKDPLKVNMAKENNLNYKIFWSLNELIEWLK